MKSWLRYFQIYMKWEKFVEKSCEDSLEYGGVLISWLKPSLLALYSTWHVTERTV